MSTLKRIALALLIIGGINWGLVGLFQFDLVAQLFGGQESGFSRVVYTLVGLSSLVCIPMLFARMDETENTTSDQTVRSRNLSYGTEFAEENDDYKVKNRDDDTLR
ncbi:DUF378 domain-containing protein [Ornithinibacillus scapharcae]|uniref:DUF378 domain-containing protein n=1 Tax=Ornithinibacillus scapharcae TaxID=1147159 RepID=UPI000225BE25|nr:DUF378 domain-containing protein [Ornithinibacillus scapharcae]